VLQTFLDTKPLYYDEIDYTRMPRIYQRIRPFLKIPKIIHLIGTNGKGTTGRFLASALYSLGFDVGHYTSPHILEFNERLWHNGSNVSYAKLDSVHTNLLALLTPQEADALSYFEYTTLLAVLLYGECDYIVLEAGLGGEYDATAVFENIVTLVTPIDFDHEAFLGNNISAIATTKLNAVQSKAILAKQVHPEVSIIAQQIAQKKSLEIKSYDIYLDEKEREKIALIAKNNALPLYLVENLKLAVAALKHLQLSFEVQDFSNAKLFGRLSCLNKNILIDVGHNTLAAKSIYNALKENKYILVYNSYKDKNYKEILSILQPIILHVEIIEVLDDRIEEPDKLLCAIEELGIEYRAFEQIEDDENYLVFGSFSVVETFLKGYRG